MMSYEGATIKKVLVRFALLGFFICPLSKASFARRQIKNPALRAGLFYRAQDWIRTSTWFPTLRPEHSASTNFATWAVDGKYSSKPAKRFYLMANFA
jgi:hypothetical protein